MPSTSLEPAAMPPLPLSHTQGGIAADTAGASRSHSTVSSNSRSAPFDATRRTPTMTTMTKPQDPPVPITAVTIDPIHKATSTEPTSSAEATPTSSNTSDVQKPLKKHSKKKKKRGSSSASELTPLIRKGSNTASPSSEEEVFPLPWFRSPEWTRKSPLLNTNDKRRKSSNRFRRGQLNREQTSLCNALMSKLCCGVSSSDNDIDLELGTRLSDPEELESEGFKQCVQILVGLIVVVAAVLIVMIIFQPFQQEASLW